MILIDGDVLVYRAAWAAQKRDTPLDPADRALYSLWKMIDTIKSRLSQEEIKVFLTSSDKSNYRYSVAKRKPYKSNRPPKPHYYNLLRTYLTRRYNTEVVYGREADDALVTHLYSNTNYICASIDKDLRQGPGLHYDIVEGTKQLVSDPGELIVSSNRLKLKGGGYKWFYAQMLLGDVVDSIPGVNGYGPVKTEALLSKIVSEEECVCAVFKVYEEVFKEQAKEYFFEAADLLWIQRKEGEIKSEYLKALMGG